MVRLAGPSRRPARYRVRTKWIRSLFHKKLLKTLKGRKIDLQYSRPGDESQICNTRAQPRLRVSGCHQPFLEKCEQFVVDGVRVRGTQTMRSSGNHL